MEFMTRFLRTTMLLSTFLAMGTAHADNAAAKEWDTMPSVTPLSPVSLAGGNYTKKLILDKLRIDITAGDLIGQQGYGWFCVKRDFRWVQQHDVWFRTQLGRIMSDELDRLGYVRIKANSGSLYSTDVSNAPDLRIGATLRKALFNQCNSIPLTATSSHEAKGWSYFKIDWEIYSEKEQRVVLSKTTEGLGYSEQAVPELDQQGIRMVVDNLLNSPEFMAVTKDTPETTDVAQASEPASTTSNDPSQSTLSLIGGAIPKGGVAKDQDQLRSAVVTVETVNGTGSGFYVDQAGYLLTDYHVVKGAKYVKIKFKNGDKYVGEVVRVNEMRDVALIKTQGIEMTPLAIHKGSPSVGDDVYAIGSPIGLESTITHGILSADRTIQNVHWLQSDVNVTNGNSGGPLLDKDGAVIGICARGGATVQSKGFNLFIPISDALKSISVELK